MSNDNVRLGREDLLQAYRTMKTIREFEERVHAEFATGELPGFVHLYAGEEAAAAGIMLNLRQDDHIASTHRGHGPLHRQGGRRQRHVRRAVRARHRHLSRQGRLHAHRGSRPGHDGGQRHPGRGRAAGLRRGPGIQVQEGRQRGGQLRRRRRFQRGQLPGEPQSGRSVGSPAIFVVENNAYAQSTSRDYAVAVDSYVDRASGFGMPGVTVDGTDFFAVHEAAGEMIARARDGGGPSLLECGMIRFFGHYEGDAQTYRAPGEVEDIRANRDCLTKFVQQATQAETVEQGDLERIDREVAALIDQAVDEAREAPHPTAEDLLTDVYVSY